ncbi:MAG: hypothetical protein ACOWWO_14870 [Peptococcaceae bacterium]
MGDRVFAYTAVVDYYDKNKAQRVIRKTVLAKNIKEAAKKLNALGKIKSIEWEEVPNIAADRQLEFF